MEKSEGTVNIKQVGSKWVKCLRPHKHADTVHVHTGIDVLIDSYTNGIYSVENVTRCLSV